MSSGCPICYNITYLNGGSHSGLEGGRKLLHFPFPLEKLAEIGIFSCGQCMKLMESFCELHHQLQTIQLYLNWKVEVLSNVMKSAQALPARMTEFQKFIGKANLEKGKLISGDELIEEISGWRDCAIERCKQQVKHEFPKLVIKKWKPSDAGHDPDPNIQSDGMGDEDVENVVVDDDLNEDTDAYSGSESDSSSAISAPAKLGSKMSCKVANCKSIFYNNDDYKKHQKFHGQFPCVFCNSAQTSAVDLAWHEISEHSSDPSILQRKKRKQYSCPRSNCSYSSSFKKLYIRHHLQKHLKLNPNELTHTATCDICGATFTSAEHRKLPGRLRDHHENTHNLKNLKEGGTPFRCNHGDGNCNAYFLSMAQLSLHKRNYHEIRTNLNCPICNARFEDEESVRKHKWEHRLEGLRMDDDKNNLIVEDRQRKQNHEVNDNYISTDPELLPTVMESVEPPENENVVKLDIQVSKNHYDSSSESDNYYNELDDIDKPFAEPTGEEFMDWESQEMKIHPSSGSAASPLKINQGRETDVEGCGVNQIPEAKQPYLEIKKVNVEIEGNADRAPSQSQSLLAEDVGGREELDQVVQSDSDSDSSSAISEEPAKPFSSKIVCKVANCKSVFYNEEAYKNHQKFHGQFPCIFCDAVKISAEELAWHEISEHSNDHSKLHRKKRKLYVCPRPNCLYSSTFKKHYIRHHLQQHLRLNPSELTHTSTCEICGAIFTSTEHRKLPGRAKDHQEKFHNLKNLKEGDTPLRCDQEGCTAYFLLSRQLSLHKLNIHQIKSYLTCSDCNKGFKDHEKLRKHKENHHAEVLIHPCTVPGCAYSSETKNGLEIHIRVRHDQLDKNGPLKCLECEKSFISKTGLMSHMKMHSTNSNEGRRICEKCGKVFKSKDKLRQHYLSHSGPESWRFQCDLCSKKCVNRTKLEEHMRTHAQEKPFICEICGAKYAHAHNLRIHVSNKHRTNLK